MESWTRDGCLTRDNERQDETFLSRVGIVQVRKRRERDGRGIGSGSQLTASIYHKINNKLFDWDNTG